MKAFGLIAAAGLMAATLGVGTTASASAQSWHGDRHGWHDRYDRGHHWRGDRWRGERWHRGYGWRARYGWHGGYRRCWTEWRYHYRVRVCR